MCNVASETDKMAKSICHKGSDVVSFPAPLHTISFSIPHLAFPGH